MDLEQLVADEPGEGEGEGEGTSPPKKKQKSESFDMPWRTATIMELGQRAYIRDSDETAEWLWVRLHEALGMKTDSYKFLKNSLASLKQFLEKDLQVDFGEVRYNPGKTLQDNRQWKDHTLESRALLGFCFWVLRNKPLKEDVKKKACNLLQRLAELAVEKGMQLDSNLEGMVVGMDGIVHYQSLEMKRPHFLKNLGKLLDHCPGAKSMWQTLRGVMWHDHTISTAVDFVSISDLVWFLGYLAAHTTTVHRGKQDLWLCCGKVLLPTLVNQFGAWLDAIAIDLANEELHALPVLKSKFGNVCKTMDPVNRMLLLRKLQGEKVHRRRIGKTHDLQPLESTWSRHEHFLDCVLHARALLKDFECEPLQLSISYDPGNYDGKQISAGVAYNPRSNRAAYLLSQTMGKLMMSDLDEQLIQKAHQRKLTRIPGFNELRSLDAMLVHSLGIGVKDFAVPGGLFVKPLAPTQVRVRGKDGRAYIVDTNTSAAFPEVSPDINLSELKILVTCSDQGPLNVASLNFLMLSSHAHMCLCLWDPYHRGWNDIKGAAKKASSGAYRCILELTTLFNTNYGPFTSSQWFHRKRSALEEFLSSTTVNSQKWQDYEAWICLERRIDQPSCEEDRVALFNSMSALENFVTKGPLVKLMRWFSWFECCAHWQNDFFATKMVLESEAGLGEMKPEVVESDHDIEQGNEKTEKEKLSALKKRVGTYNLAPRLITPKNMAIKEILMSVCRHTWKSFAHRASNIRSPEQVMQMNIQNTGQGAWKDELVGMLHCSLSREDTIQHLLPEWSFHEKTVDWHAEQLEELLQARAISLSNTYCTPPMKYCHTLSSSEQEGKLAQALAIKDFGALLNAESAAHQCTVQPLKQMTWRLNPFARAVYVAHDMDQHTGSQHAKALHSVYTKSLGDSRIIENIHQHGRDLQRASKNDGVGNTGLFANVLRSGCLEERRVPMVKAPNADKVVEGSAFLQEPISKKLTVKGHKLSGGLQEMMLPKTRHQNWPSPSPSALFQGVCASEWVFNFFGKAKGEEYKCNINLAWLTILAKKGWMVAQRSTSRLLKVVAGSEYAFLGWQAEATPVPLGSDVVFTLVENKECLSFHHIFDLEDWLFIPTKPRLLTPMRGPLGWERCGDPLPLQSQMCLEGCKLLTNTQLVALVKHLGGEPPKRAKRRELQELVTAMCLGGELQAAALKKIEESEKTMDSEEIDSQFSEILSDLDKEEGNRQDIQEFKKKKQVQNAKRKLAARDKPVGQKKKKGKGKGRGKGKGKGKGKNKKDPAKKQAKRSFMSNFLKKRKHGGSKVDQEPNQDKVAPPEPEPIEVPIPDTETSGQMAPPDPEPIEEQTSTLPGEERLECEADGEEETKEKKDNKSFKKQHRSPDDILSQISPPHCFIGLGFNDWRFQSSWRLPAKVQESLLPPYCQKSMSKTFFKARPWREALTQVHQFNWEKFHLVKDQISLPSSLEVQKPGKVPDHVFEALEPIINKMEEPKSYGKAKKT